mmetsp:Transcript_38146/g.91689  ORF Transcript_38146/g.91689 Transcript_38146/m.91689 type:complete len:82 (-) Transcript_38146:321-566(-)
MKDEPKVTFLDVECRQNPWICKAQEAGRGGWPTIKYYNANVGAGGRGYSLKTDGRMCEELGKVDYMRAYVDDAAQLGSAEL